MVESELVITQYVGADDRLIHKLTFDLDFLMDIAALLTPNQQTEESPPIEVTLLFDVEPGPRFRVRLMGTRAAEQAGGPDRRVDVLAAPPGAPAPGGSNGAAPTRGRVRTSPD